MSLSIFRNFTIKDEFSSLFWKVELRLTSRKKRNGQILGQTILLGKTKIPDKLPKDIFM